MEFNVSTQTLIVKLKMALRPHSTVRTMASGFPSSKYMSSSQDFPIQIHGWLRIHKDGRCERFIGNHLTLAGTDPLTGVRSKDAVISKVTFARIYIPETVIPRRKLPTLIYYHGGAFVVESAASSTYQPTLNLITAESNVILVSVNYRLAPEHPLPAAYEDSWEAIKWVASHAQGNGPDSWLNDYADLQNVFFAGDSAGANIAHHMAIRFGLTRDVNTGTINLKGIILLNPYFGGKDPTEDETKEYHEFLDQMWKLANPSSGLGLDDPWFNPAMDPCISGLGCSRIFVCVSEKDKLRASGLNYKKLMDKSRWKGRVEVLEIKGEPHVFFLADTASQNACMLRNRVCTFINPIPSKA